MGIKDLFDTEAPRNRRQNNWLKMVASIPGAKRAFNGPVTAEDEALAKEASELLQQDAYTHERNPDYG